MLETSVAGPCGTGEADTTHSEISHLVRGRKCLAADERQRLLEAAAGPPERQSWILSRYVWRQRALPGGANSAIRHHASILRMFQQHSIAIACYKTVQETANRILLQQRHDTAAPVDFHFTIGSILYRRPLTAVAPEADFHFTQGDRGRQYAGSWRTYLEDRLACPRRLRRRKFGHHKKLLRARINYYALCIVGPEAVLRRTLLEELKRAPRLRAMD